MAITCPNCDKSMGLTCPSCTFEHNCGCSNCKGTTNIVIIDYDNDLYQCCSCGYKFDEQESIDYDWDKMIKKFKDEISPELCLIWIKSIGKDRRVMESKFGQYGFEQAFRQHFGIHHTECNENIFQQLQRDLKINDILE